MNRPAELDALRPVPHVAIACGGTGGHLFPGLAVGRELRGRGCEVTLFLSEKEVDRKAAQGIHDLRCEFLPSVGMVRGRWLAFFRNLWRSKRMAQRAFAAAPVQAVLAMGGFTSAGPILAGRKAGAACFLHESNVIPGRANRWLARYADDVFLGFEAARTRFKKARCHVTGTPVRGEFFDVDAATARTRLGLRAEDPVLLIMGGSQGAAGINRLVLEALPGLVERFPRLQFIHLTGVQDLAAVQAVYHRIGVPALVQLFCAEMHLALGAASLVVSRAGASSLAEIAAVGAPSVLIPYPAAADNHQLFNALQYTGSDAALLVEQGRISGPEFERQLRELLEQPERLSAMGRRLKPWQAPDAAVRIAEAILACAPVRAKRSDTRSRSGLVDRSDSPMETMIPAGT